MVDLDEHEQALTDNNQKPISGKWLVIATVASLIAWRLVIIWGIL